ncbi:MAG: TIM barrel protein [Bryobacteraceae bacterium]|nr:TIM barrel protein [Bryobacteraceae bacterium]MDW8380324.1 TIM barrel protein [Bryobacterales bacterium]
MTPQQYEQVFDALDSFEIELPSWGFANTGTRFGKFIQAAAATTIEEKLSDASQVHAVTGCSPSVAVHVLWDFPNGLAQAPQVKQLARRYGVRIGSINPNVFQDQIYKFGSLGNPDAEIRQAALEHLIESVHISQATASRDISLWFADGSNYPGTQNIRKRRQWFLEGLSQLHQHLGENQRLLLEYKPFEPAFYHTDIADWGMALLLARHAGPQAKVLVDLGHHYPSQNIEQVVAWLLAEGMLGGFHFNDRRYADDDLTLGSIDPYQLFRIFHEICTWEWETGERADIAYMIDQSHNLKGKIEAMIQSVVRAQELYVKALLVDHEKLAKHQQSCELVDAEECLQRAFYRDVSPILEEWRRSRRLPLDPLQAFRQSGYLERVSRERAERNRDAVTSYA